MSYDDDTFGIEDFYGSTDEVEDVGGDDEVIDFDDTVTDDAPLDEGQGEVTDEGTDEVPAPEKTYFDLSPYADQVIAVKVDGEDLEVPVAELPNGFMRQADYTRKTQEVAQQREQLKFWGQVDEAMRVNPRQTLKYLQETYGINEAQASAQLEQDPEDTWWSDDDQQQAPADSQLRAELAPVIEFVQQQRAEQQLRQVVAGLSNKYGDDFNAQEVVNEAANRGVYDPNMLEAVFKDMSFDKYRAMSSAQLQAAAEKAATNSQRQAAARTAGRVIGTGASASGGAAAASPPPRVRTVADAYRLAKAELEAS